MKDLIKKWWLWLILLISIVVIGVILIILIGFNMINPDKNLANLSKELQEYYEDTTVYQSAGKNTIIIECNFDNKEEATEKTEKIGEIIGKYIDYLSIYKNINMNIYTKDGTKTNFVIDIETKKMTEDKEEVWILEDSTAYNEEQNKLKDIQTKQSELNSEISLLENKKQSLNTEIQQLNGEVTKAKGKPKTYPAGQLTAGTDVPIGKYKIYGGNSNFIVYSSSGSLEVNIVLGSGTYDVNEYIYTFKTGDIIKANSSFKLVSIE